jgi:hypothetical protein
MALICGDLEKITSDALMPKGMAKTKTKFYMITTLCQKWKDVWADFGGEAAVERLKKGPPPELETLLLGPNAKEWTFGHLVRIVGA